MEIRLRKVIKRDIDEAELQSERQTVECRSSVENSPSGSPILSTVFKRGLILLHFLTLVPCVSTFKNSIPSWASFPTFTHAHLKHRSNVTLPWDILWSLISLNLQSDFFLICSLKHSYIKFTLGDTLGKFAVIDIFYLINDKRMIELESTFYNSKWSNRFKQMIIYGYKNY